MTEHQNRADPPVGALVAGYELHAAFDEMFDRDLQPRPHYQVLDRLLHSLTPEEFRQRKTMSDLTMRREGVGFTVYRAEEGIDRVWPMDPVPRIIPHHEWKQIEDGLVQRITALNLFLNDVYHEQKILRDRVIDPRLVFGGSYFRREFMGAKVPRNLYIHICGTDLIRAEDGRYLVLEDNCRTPSGVSYMLENREATMRLFPDLIRRHRIRPVSHYPEELLGTLRSVAPPAASDNPTVVLLTPGSYNSAYYEHSFLADEMGVELVEGVDLVVEDLVVYMRTTRGRQRVDVVYRRIDDAFLDPLAFRPDSALGVPGLMAAYRAGNVTLANAVGAGIADDKAVYTYVPEMVRFFLGEEPILKNVPTYRCSEADERAHVLDRLHELVVKDVHGSGGYGMLVGPHATKAERAAFAEKIRTAPDRYIAQPTLSLSTCPTFVDNGIAPRHVDLRPFVLSGRDIRIVPGGLTRVALREGSLVVNSSQGGGTKDTWVLDG